MIDQKRILVENLDSGLPTPLQGITNTWCVSALLDDDLALVHFVKTVSNIDELPIANT